MADVVAIEEALADVVAIEETLGDCGGVLPWGKGDGSLDDEDDGELQPLDDEERSDSGEMFSNLDLSLSPATLLQSMDL